MLHLVGKVVVHGKLRRHWDTAQTPYQRLLASGVLSPEQQARLAALYRATNPRQLREEIYRAVERLWQQPKSDLPTGQVYPPWRAGQQTNRKEAASAAR